MICEYCGTQFREELNAIKVVTYNPHIHTLGAKVVIDQCHIEASPTEMAEFAIREMAQQFARGIAQYMDVKTRFSPELLATEFYAKLRVVNSNYRFD